MTALVQSAWSFGMTVSGVQISSHRPPNLDAAHSRWRSRWRRVFETLASLHKPCRSMQISSATARSVQLVPTLCCTGLIVCYIGATEHKSPQSSQYVWRVRCWCKPVRRGRLYAQVRCCRLSLIRVAVAPSASAAFLCIAAQPTLLMLVAHLHRRYVCGVVVWH